MNRSEDSLSGIKHGPLIQREYHRDIMNTSGFNIKGAAILASAIFAVTGHCTDVPPSARLEVIEISGTCLQDNPLQDPMKRRLAAFFPAQYESGQEIPVVYYLNGYGCSSENLIRSSKVWLDLVQRASDAVTPFILVAVDARTRWGCSQYLDSPAQGNYATYICDEILPEFEQSHHLNLKASERLIAGHSSGGFGALRIAMMRKSVFGAVIALSPDSDFPTTHLPPIQASRMKDTTPAEVDQMIATPISSWPEKWASEMMFVGLSAAYAPAGPEHPGKFEWLYDSKGKFQPNVWQRWLENDPLTIVREHEDAFAPEQRIYLDGAALDEWGANIGAHKIYDVLSARHAQCAFYEPPGHHGEHQQDRLQRGLAWVFNKPMVDIK